MRFREVELSAKKQFRAERVAANASIHQIPLYARNVNISPQKRWYHRMKALNPLWHSKPWGGLSYKYEDHRLKI